MQQVRVDTDHRNMASGYSNWTLRKCDQSFDKYFRKFETRRVNNKGMQELKSGQSDWIKYYYIGSDRNFSGRTLAAFIHSLNLKVWYRLNRQTLRGEICIRNIHDGASATSSSGKRHLHRIRMKTFDFDKIKLS